MSSPPVSPASPSLSRAGRRGLKTTVGFGLKPRKPYARFDRSLSFWRMLRHSLHTPTHSDKFSVTFTDSGMMRNGELFQQENLADSTTESGSSLYPTPTASIADGGINWAKAQRDITISSLQEFLAQMDLRDGLTKLSGGRANPLFVEWLMGFPLGWSQIDSGDWEMLSFPR